MTPTPPPKIRSVRQAAPSPEPRKSGLKHSAYESDQEANELISKKLKSSQQDLEQKRTDGNVSSIRPAVRRNPMRSCRSSPPTASAVASARSARGGRGSVAAASKRGRGGKSKSSASPRARAQAESIRNDHAQPSQPARAPPAPRGGLPSELWRVRTGFLNFNEVPGYPHLSREMGQYLKPFLNLPSKTSRRKAVHAHSSKKPRPNVTSSRPVAPAAAPAAPKRSVIPYPKDRPREMDPLEVARRRAVVGHLSEYGSRRYSDSRAGSSPPYVNHSRTPSPRDPRRPPPTATKPPTPDPGPNPYIPSRMPGRHLLFPPAQ